MNKKRMSERKSELRLDIQDFCLGLSQNSDPIIAYLLTILQWQASLDIETNSILHKSFIFQIQQLKCKLRMQIKSSKSKSSTSDSQKPNIAKYIKQFHKLKQVFSYCLTLSKKKSELCFQLEKFNEYKPKQHNFTQDLQNYLNQPIIFQTIFHSYLRAYNINILTADLISFLYAEHEQKSHQKTEPPKSQKMRKWSNSDIELLNNKSIIFKQLTDMSKKYMEQEQKLQISYIYHLCHDMFQVSNSVDEAGEQIKDQYDGVLRDKVKKMNTILNKIKSQSTLCGLQNINNVILESEPIDNLNTLYISEGYTEAKVIEDNKQFFLETLYGKSWTQVLIGDEEFTFMRQKIIKVEALSYLNRIVSTINVISFVYNQLDLQVRPIYDFEFQNLRKLIGCEFISKQTHTSKVSYNSHRTCFFTVDPQIKTYTVIDEKNNKILYPSAINYFFCFIKVMLSTDFSSRQGLLEILQAKSEYLQSFAETIINIYQIIKVKQLSCYKLLREFIQTILKSSCWNCLANYKQQAEIMLAVNQEKEKIGIISQIIYQFDHNYSIQEPLQQVIRIQFDGLTRNCDDTFSLYKKILSQIIQIRNGLKLDHYYSVNQIHEAFSLIPPDIERLDEKTKTKHQDLYFEDIVHEICLASQANLHLPKLFFFFDLQLKFKRIVFKLQLCWSLNLESMFQKKVQAFKDFLSTYCSPIFEIVKQCHNIIEILDRLQDIERHTQVFSRQVSRFHLIQKIIKIFSLQKHQIQTNFLRENMSRLTLSDLQQLSILLSTFNPVQCQKQSNRHKFIQTLSKHMKKYSSIRIQQLQYCTPKLIKQKQKLASIIILLQMLRSRNDPRDHSDMISLYRGVKPVQDLYQRKLYEQADLQYRDWLKCQNINQLIKYNEELLVLSILRTLRDIEAEAGLQSQDYKELNKLMSKFQLSKLFNNLQSIEEIQFWKNQLGIMTKYHQIYQLMYHFDAFNNETYGTLNKMSQYKERKMLNLLNHKLDFNHQRSDFITKMYFISQVSQLSRQKVQRNLQTLQKQILEADSLHLSVAYYRGKLKKKLYVMFCEEINKVIQRNFLCQDIDIEFNGTKEPSEYIDMLRRKMLRAVSQYKTSVKQNGYGKFSQIQMFKVKKGYELSIIEQKQNKEYKIGTKKHVQRNKKPLLSPNHQSEQRTKPLDDLKRKFKTQMLKKSIQIRKQISKMQLSQNKIREQIIWETSKLEHSVVEKINQFIALSNVDQQQSYINFKHAVNLETMKGIENVIQEQTQMYNEKKNAALEEQEENEGFITGVPATEQQKQVEKNIDRSMKHLDANIDSMLAHMKKIKFFSAWKKSLKKTDMTKKQWCNFNLNVQNILNNDKIVQLVQQIQNSRDSYLQQNVTCEIIKQENSRINDKIQDLKINNLEKKVKNYIDKLNK